MRWPLRFPLLAMIYISVLDAQNTFQTEFMLARDGHLYTSSSSSQQFHLMLPILIPLCILFLLISCRRDLSLSRNILVVRLPLFSCAVIDLLMMILTSQCRTLPISQFLFGRKPSLKIPRQPLFNQIMKG